MAITPGDILKFWFEECEQKHWWVKSSEFDAAVRDRFGGMVEDAAAGKLDHWAESAEGNRALIILLDQFTRNIYRGSAKAFEADEKARAIARSAIALGLDKGLNNHEKNFMYLPLEHSESREHQQFSVKYFTALRDEAPKGYTDEAEATLKYALDHKVIVELIKSVLSAAFGLFRD